MRYITIHEYISNNDSKFKRIEYNKTTVYFISSDIKVIYGYGTYAYPYIHLLFDRYFKNKPIFLGK